MLQWDDVRVFLALARNGSHRRAAAALAVDATTVSRRLSALETGVGATLFVRTPDGLRTTAAGRRLLARAERMEAEAIAAERELSAEDESPSGPLRVTATESVVNCVLVPGLAALRREHPGLGLELLAEARVLDLSRREADVAIRLGRVAESALVAQRLGTLEFAVFASREYLERRGTPRTLRALTGHDWVGFDASFDRLPQSRWLFRHVPEPRFALRSNASTTQVLACAGGHGLALLPTFVTRAEPALVRILARTAGPKRELWGVVHPDLRATARVRAFFGWARRELAATGGEGALPGRLRA